MSKKILVTSTDLMMIQFLIPHVNYLSENGYEVTIACSQVGDRIEEIKKVINDDVKLEQVRLVRNPKSPQNLKGYKDLKKLINENRFDIIWTNEPVMGVMTRAAAREARKNGTIVVYIAHGFHFYKGAPKLNWLAYPIEKLMAGYNDVLVTINWEDYYRAKKRFSTPNVEHIDGIGLDTENYAKPVDRATKRKELDIGEDDTLIVSIGELQKRKNHEPMIRAIAKLNDPRIKYYICGRGILQSRLESVIAELELEDQVKLLGYRRDINEILHAADIYAHPSLREGLGLASLEAMAVGLPLVTSNVQGIPDYVIDGKTGFKCDPMDVDKYAENIRHIMEDKPLAEAMRKNNLEQIKKYDIKNIQKAIKDIFEKYRG